MSIFLRSNLPLAAARWCPSPFSSAGPGWAPILAEMVKKAPVSVPQGPDWWVGGGRADQLAPWGQAKLWALHRVNWELGLGMDDAAMAELVQKPNGESPSKQAVQKFRAAIDADPAWYPGKGHAEGAKPGPKPRFTKAKQLAVARSAMALKEADEEPTVAAVVRSARWLRSTRTLGCPSTAS